MQPNLSILVVDDDLLDRTAIRRAVQAAEPMTSITEGIDCASALATVEQASFDCILLDYRLPDADGLTFVTEIRRRGVSAPIVILTGQSDQRVAVALMKAGATDYLSKDELTPGRLLQSIRSSIRLQQAEQQAARTLQESVERLRFQADTSKVLAASLDAPTILANLTRLLVAQLADWGAVSLLEPGGALHRASTYPDHTASGWESDRGWYEQLAAATALETAAIGAARPFVSPCLDEDETLARCADELLPPGVAGAVICIPLAGHHQLQGALTLVRRQGRPPFSVADLALVQDLAQRVAVTLDNAQLYRQTQSALRMRDDFLSIAAHELRTPLTSMMGYVQLLERRLARSGSLAEREGRMLRTIADQTQRMSQMINRLLDASRLNSGQFLLERTPISLTSMITRVAEEQSAGLARHTLDLALPDEPLLIIGDEIGLQQVFQNLLHNAIKYSPDGGKIAVRAAAQGHWASVSVSDSGIGIPAEAIPKLFRRFFRASNADERAISGIGLGLYVVHEIISLHGGMVEVESDVGAGSTFTVRLPMLHTA